MTVEILSPAMRDLIDGDAPVELLCKGFTFTEGPIWNPRDACM
jgi:sugar lactone lactonase YvrE